MGIITKRKTKQKDLGITLIALVITIIVLLILAGISIAMLTGENGILTKADQATKETEIAEAKEQAKLDIAEWTAEQLEKSKNADIDNSIIQKILQSKGEAYVKNADTDRFTTKKNGYEILYSELYHMIGKNPAKKIQFSLNGITYETEEGTSWLTWVDTLTQEQIDNLDYNSQILFTGSPTQGLGEWRKGTIDGYFTSHQIRHWIEDSKGNIPNWSDSLVEGEVYTANEDGY